MATPRIQAMRTITTQLLALFVTNIHAAETDTASVAVDPPGAMTQFEPKGGKALIGSRLAGVDLDLRVGLQGETRRVVRAETGPTCASGGSQEIRNLTNPVPNCKNEL